MTVQERLASVRARNQDPVGPGPLTTEIMDIERPWGTRRPRVLLCTVFKPFNIVDEYNAPDNIYEMGVFHRSFTKRQGFFTMIQEQHTYPLHLIAHNLEADTTVLEFASLEEFIAEIGKGYDVVGINAMVSTATKARRMCEEVKARSPSTLTVLGGGSSLGVGELYAQFSDHVCRGDGVSYVRALLGQDPTQEVTFPIFRLHNKVHGLLGLPLADHNYPVTLGLGCPRQCEFCSTSAQFGGRYTPLFKSGEGLFRFMQATERKATENGARPWSKGSYLSFMVYDENYLLNFSFVDEFRRLNREQALRDPQYLMFGFADAEVLSTYSPEDLLEIGLDTIWVGVEAPSLRTIDKTSQVDVRAIIENLASSGIKVIGSLIAGLEEHNEERIREDIDYALTLSTVGIQYMPVNPIPGTAYYEKMKAKGLIPDRSPNFFNMSHYSLKHPTLTEEKVLELLTGFFDREHLLGGPLVYRFLKGRWQGYLKYRFSANPYVRGRTRVFASDLRRGYPVMLIGEALAPSEETRRLFRQLRREVQAHFRWGDVLSDTLLRRIAPDEGGIYLMLSTPGLREVWRQVLLANALLKDPRSQGWKDLVLHRKEALARTATGTVPWGQPETIRTPYPQAP